MIIGYVTIDSVEYADKNRFNELFNLHCVPVGSKFDCKEESGKYCYYLSNPEKCNPYELKVKVNHGRSYCEV